MGHKNIKKEKREIPPTLSASVFLKQVEVPTGELKIRRRKIHRSRYTLTLTLFIATRARMCQHCKQHVGPGLFLGPRGSNFGQ